MKSCVLLCFLLLGFSLMAQRNPPLTAPSIDLTPVHIAGTHLSVPVPPNAIVSTYFSRIVLPGKLEMSFMEFWGKDAAAQLREADTRLTGGEGASVFATFPMTNSKGISGTVIHKQFDSRRDVYQFIFKDSTSATMVSTVLNRYDENTLNIIRFSYANLEMMYRGLAVNPAETMAFSVDEEHPYQLKRFNQSRFVFQLTGKDVDTTSRVIIEQRPNDGQLTVDDLMALEFIALQNSGASVTNILSQARKNMGAQAYEILLEADNNGKTTLEYRCFIVTKKIMLVASATVKTAEEGKKIGELIESITFLF